MGLRGEVSFDAMSVASTIWRGVMGSSLTTDLQCCWTIFPTAFHLGSPVRDLRMSIVHGVGEVKHHIVGDTCHPVYPFALFELQLDDHRRISSLRVGR